MNEPPLHLRLDTSVRAHKMSKSSFQSSDFFLFLLLLNFWLAFSEKFVEKIHAAFNKLRTLRKTKTKNCSAFLLMNVNKSMKRLLDSSVNEIRLQARLVDIVSALFM